MPEENSQYKKDEIWRHDMHAFLFAMCKYWYISITTILGSGFVAIWQNWGQGGRVIPGWVLGLVPMFGIAIASFLAFRGQRRIAESESRDAQQAKEELAKIKKVALAIELEYEKDIWTPDPQNNQSYTCRIAVRNTSQFSTADDVRLLLTKIEPLPQHFSKPLGYELGVSGTNYNVRTLQLHANSRGLFELFRFSTDPAIKCQMFSFQHDPISNQMQTGPPTQFILQKYDSGLWELEIQAAGRDLASVTERFKLEVEAGSPPRLVRGG